MSFLGGRAYTYYPFWALYVQPQKTMKRTLFILVIAFIVVLPVRAQFNSQVMQCSTEFVKNVIVRNYYTDREIIFAYKEDPSVIYSNPPFVGQYQTKIYSKLDNSTGVSITSGSSSIAGAITTSVSSTTTVSLSIFLP